MTNESLFQPVRTRRGFEAVCDRIREQLMSGELKPGDQLPGERELAERFGIGRAAARDALRSLEVSGVVEARKGIRAASSSGMAAAAVLRRRCRTWCRSRRRRWRT